MSISTPKSLSFCQSLVSVNPKYATRPSVKRPLCLGVDNNQKYQIGLLFQVLRGQRQFEAGFGVVRTSKDFWWNAIYKAFHRIFVETNQWVKNNPNVIYCIDTANLRPALRYGCEKHTPSAKIVVRQVSGGFTNWSDGIEGRIVILKLKGGRQVKDCTRLLADPRGRST